MAIFTWATSNKNLWGFKNVCTITLILIAAASAWTCPYCEETNAACQSCCFVCRENKPLISNVHEAANLDDDDDDLDKENIPPGGNEQKRKKSSPSMMFCSP